MTGVKIEVFDNKESADQRSLFYKAKGFNVTGPRAYQWASWANHIAGGVSDQALDPADLEVWLLTAEK